MRTVDVARQAACSAQQVRKLEAAGVLPPVKRTPGGWREFDGTHLASLLAYQGLSVAVGPVQARHLMVTAHSDLPALMAKIDAAHARLHRERCDLAEAREAVRHISNEPIVNVKASDAMSITELASALDVRTSTLRHWEAEHLLTPSRGPHRARVYSPADARDARIVHQLRQAGYRIQPLHILLQQLREEGDWDNLLDDRSRDIETRSRALLGATIKLSEAVCPPASP
jgi:DNA-binding transcriptional MerR regulator